MNLASKPPSPLEFPGPLTPPTPSEFPIPSVVGVWIFSGTTHYQNKKISNESAECREKRLLNQRQYQNKRIANESAECREERLLNQRQYQKEKLANESADHRQERLAKQHQYQKEKNLYNSTITDEIRKFLANISRGPEYICSCCNQL